MPKRTTTTYSSEDAPKGQEAQLAVYYCRFSGQAALITDANVAALPRRRTDGAAVLDTERFLVRLKAAEGAAKAVRRGEGRFEPQYRYYCGDLPVAYRTERGGRYVYLLENALTAYAGGDAGGAKGAGGNAAERPVPPCIQRQASGAVQVALSMEERSPRTTLARISADEVTIQLADGLQTQHAHEVLLELLAKALRVRLTQLKLTRGWSQRSRLLLVDASLSPRDVYTRLTDALDREQRRFGGGGGSGAGGPGEDGA